MWLTAVACSVPTPIVGEGQDAPPEDSGTDAYGYEHEPTPYMGWPPGRAYAIAWPPSGADVVDAAFATISGADEDRVGSTVATFGDVDGDGTDELLVVADHWGASNAHRGGRAQLTSGTALTTGDHAFESLGTAVVGTEDSPYFDAAAIGDWTGDRVADLGFAYRDPSNHDPGSAFYVVDGAAALASEPLDGSDALFTVVGSPHDSAVGMAITRIGDLDGDTAPEVLIADAVVSNGGGQGGGGRVDLWLSSQIEAGTTQSWDGASTLVEGRADGEALGYAQTGLPDVTGDGVDEVAMAIGDGDVGALDDAGEITLFDGADFAGRGLLTLDDGWGRIEGVEAYGRVGSQVVGLADLDGDGLGELAAVGVDYSASDLDRVYVFSGWQLGGLVHPTDAASVVDEVEWVAQAPDLDGDGVRDLTLRTGEGFDFVSGSTVMTEVVAIDSAGFDGIVRNERGINATFLESDRGPVLIVGNPDDFQVE
jgi:hypothetical protein